MDACMYVSCLWLSHIPSFSVRPPRSCSSTSSSSNTVRRRPTWASWSTDTEGGGSKGTATAAPTTPTGNLKEKRKKSFLKAHRHTRRVCLTCVGVFSESSDKKDGDSPEWSFTTVRKRKKDERPHINGQLRREAQTAGSASSSLDTVIAPVFSEVWARARTTTTTTRARDDVPQARAFLRSWSSSTRSTRKIAWPSKSWNITSDWPRTRVPASPIGWWRTSLPGTPFFPLYFVPQYQPLES